MVTMVNMINELCGDDKSLCEAILDLYKQIPTATMGERIWKRIETEYREGRLGKVLAERSNVNMVPKGLTLLVAGALLRIYFGTANDIKPVVFNQAVGDRPDRLVINIGPYVSYYMRLHRHEMDLLNTNYNDLAYAVLSECKDDLMHRIDDILRQSAERQVDTDLTIDKFREMYSTDANDK